MKVVYVVFEKRYFTDGSGGIEGIYSTKKEAMSAARNGGWTWNKEQKIFLNDKVGNLRTVDKYPFGRTFDCHDSDLEYDVND